MELFLSIYLLQPDQNCSVDEDTQLRLARHKLSDGDLILARRGELGRCAVVQKNQSGWLCGTGSLKTTLSPELVPDYAFMLVSSESVKNELSLESKGSTMENLNTETLGKIRLPIPPTYEQNDILTLQRHFVLFPEKVSVNHRILADLEL